MLPACLTSRRLLVVLHTQLQQCHKSQLASHVTSTDCADRNEVVEWLLTLNSRLRFSSDTMALAVMLLDRFNDLMKIQSKYLRCVAVSCLYVAVKINEEDEIIPSTHTFVRQTGCGYTVSEVLRMERIILCKLQWDLRSPTAVDFIHILHALMMTEHADLLEPLSNVTPSKHAAGVVTKLLACLPRRALATHGPVTLALSLISLELETFSSRWFAVTLSLQRLVKVDNAELIQCRERVTRHLAPPGRSHAAYRLTLGLRKPLSVKRKVTPDAIIDGVKRPYSDTDDEIVLTSCSSEVRADADDNFGATVVAT